MMGWRSYSGEAAKSVDVTEDHKGFVRLEERATRYDLVFTRIRRNGYDSILVCIINWGANTGCMTLPVEDGGWIYVPFPRYIDEKMGLGEVGAEAIHRFLTEHGDQIREVAYGETDYFYHKGP